MSTLHGRRIVLGVSGGIAAYKAIDVCRRLVDAGAHVMPVLTDDAQRFVGALTFSALASEPARTSLFAGSAHSGSANSGSANSGSAGGEPIPHTYLGQTADLIVVAPATAKLLGKYAAGISDDLLTATLLATRAPVVVAPAMHTEMWEHPAVQDNLATLRRRGVHVIDPESGRLAGGDVGEGRLADPGRIVEAIEGVFTEGHDLAGIRVLVTAGGTREPVDAVRVLTNRSSGKQGYAIAEVAARRGAAVTLVSTVGRPAPRNVEIVSVQTAAEMEAAVVAGAIDADVVIMAAAVADFRPKAPSEQKIKKADGVPEIALEPTPDILAALGERKRPDQILVGFAAETNDLVSQARSKLQRKNLDLVVGNDVSQSDAGFEVDTNRAVLIDADDDQALPLLTKIDLAGVILDRVAAFLSTKKAV
ncbi:MAG: bifunctional phosphopantothenoylcysteine decarboxylase/phosphopantothenate--cysteine ligase CoaBC [Acidimicrobiia bacterium]